jgi:hypothetical protein
MNDIMKSVNIKNKEILEILNDFIGIWWDKRESNLTKFYLSGKNKNRDDYISDAYKNKIMNMAEFHDGFPEKINAYSLKTESNNFVREYDVNISNNYLC